MLWHRIFAIIWIASNQIRAHILSQFKNNLLYFYAMPYVVTEPCIKCKYTNCAAVCPVDAFREGPNFLVIDPNECIDCDACASECPVEAIYPDDEAPEKWEHFIDLNERLAEAWEDNVINENKDALPEADEWASKEGKEDQLQEQW